LAFKSGEIGSDIKYIVVVVTNIIWL